jgi:hypothetical protein
LQSFHEPERVARLHATQAISSLSVERLKPLHRVTGSG